MNQSQPSSPWQTAIYWLAGPLVGFLTGLIATLVNKKGRAATIAKDGAETRLADANARHTEAESQQLAWERIDVLHKIIEAKDAELLKFRGLDEENKILSSWNRRMKAALTSHNIKVPDKWVSGDDWKRS